MQMNILDEILANKEKEVAEKRSLFPVKLLEGSIYFESAPVSMKKYVLREDKAGIIAEIKRKSPSKGTINKYVNVERTSIGYMQAGVSGLSILTDTKFFDGKNEDLQTARKFNYCPILRKDFIVDEYQLIEAKSIGADCILLIAAALKPFKTKELARFAKTLNLEVLLEVHDKEEYEEHISDNVDLVGVNNRDLKTFEVTLDTSKALAPVIDNRFVKISESGIATPHDIIELRNHGFNGFLMGESFMKYSRPERACLEFIEDLKELEQKRQVVDNGEQVEN